MHVKMLLCDFGIVLPRLPVILLLSVPALLCALAVWRWRGLSRFGAVILLVVTVSALAVDIKGAIHGGNLAGILTMTASVPTLLFLGILATAQRSSNRHAKDEEAADVGE